MQARQQYIWIQPATEIRWLWTALAQELFKQTGWKPILLVATDSDREFYIKNECQFHGEVIVKPDIYNMTINGNWPLSIDEAVLLIAEFEREYGVRYLGDILQADRNLGRGYQVGANGFPVSKSSQSATRENILLAGGVIVSFYKELLRKYPPAMVLCMSGGNGLHGKSMAMIARKAGALIRNLMHTRFGYRYYWAEDEFGSSTWLSKKLLNEQEPNLEALEAVSNEINPTGDFQFYVDRMRRQAGLMLMIVALFRNALKHFRSHILGSRKSKIGYSMLGEMKMIVCARLHRKLLSKKNRPMLQDFKSEQQFVFFPLQVEPEISLHGLAPDFIDQFHTLMQISRNLPVDVLLVVKEHPAQFGRRNIDFYRKIMSLPNVILISELQNSYPIICRAILTIAVNSSAVHEAAVFGKPAICLSPYGPIRTVSHVIHLSNTSEFSKIPSIIQSVKFGDNMRRRISGAKYYIGLKNNAVTFDYLGRRMFNRNYKPSPSEIAVIANSLLITLPESFI